MELRCWYCDKTLGAFKILKRELFCCADHEKLYFSEQSAIAFERVKESHPPAAPDALKLPKTSNGAEGVPEQPVVDSPEAVPVLPALELESPLPIASFLKSPIEPVNAVVRLLVSSDQDALDPQMAPPSLSVVRLDSPLLTEATEQIEDPDEPREDPPPAALLLSHPIEPVECLRPSPLSPLSQGALSAPTVPIEPQQIPLPEEALLPLVGSIRLDWNMSPLDSRSAALSSCEPTAFLEDSVLAYRAMLPWHQPELDLGPCEDEATDRPRIADCVALWRTPASTSPVPVEGAVPLTSQISAVIQGQRDWQLILTMPFWATCQLTSHSAAIESTFNALAHGPDLTIYPPAINESPTPWRDIEECAERLWIGKLVPILATPGLTARAAKSLMTNPVRIDGVQDFVSSGWTGTSPSAPVIQPIASRCLAWYPVRLAPDSSYRVIGPNPVRREIASIAPLPNWRDEKRQPVIPPLGGPNAEIRRDAGYLPVWNSAGTAPLLTLPESAVTMSGHAVREATAIFSGVFRALNPVPIAMGASRDLEWIPVEANGWWTHEAAPGFSHAYRLAIGGLAQTGETGPRLAEHVAWRKPPVDDHDAVLYFNPRWALASAAPPRTGRLARTLLTSFARGSAIVRTSLHARPSEAALSFVPQADLGEFARRIPVIGIRAFAHLRHSTPRGRFITQDRFVSLVAATPLPRIARQGGLTFPQASAADPVGLVRECSKHLFLPSLGTEGRRLKPLVERPPSPALLVAIPVRSDRMEAALGIGDSIETLALRPQRGKLHLGTPARLKRDTEIARPMANATRLEVAASATQITSGRVKLLLEPRNARTESRIEPADPVRVPPASIFGLPPLPAVTAGEMPGVPSSREDAGMSRLVPGRSTPASHLFIPAQWNALWSQTKAPTPALKPLWLRAATPPVEDVPNLSALSPSLAWPQRVAGSLDADTLPQTAGWFFAPGSSTEAQNLATTFGTLALVKWTLGPEKPMILCEFSELRPRRSGRYSALGFTPSGAANREGFRRLNKRHFAESTSYKETAHLSRLIT